jgi:LacI family transcriptional regulator
VIYPEEVDKPGVGGFLMEMLSEMRCSLEKESYHCIMTCPVNSYTKRSNVRKLINSGNVDGLIIIHWDLDEKDLELILARKVPHIFLHHIPETTLSKRSSVIVTDHFLGAKKAADYLLKLGHRDILCIAGSDGRTEYALRIEGYKQALRNENIEIDESRIVKGAHTFNFAYRYIKKNIKSITKNITAIFAQSDAMAFGVIKALLENEVRIPDDISVIGYDGSEMGGLTYPGLTSIRQPIKALVCEACNVLIHDIDSSSKRETSHIKRKLLPTLIKRDSCACFGK